MRCQAANAQERVRSYKDRTTNPSRTVSGQRNRGRCLRRRGIMEQIDGQDKRVAKQRFAVTAW